jgi:hypothetical protein
MILMRRVLIPAILSGLVLQFVLPLFFGATPTFPVDLLELALGTAVWGVFVGLGYIGAALPAEGWLARRRVPTVPRAILLLLAAPLAGAAFASLFVLPALAGGADPAGLRYWALLGATAGAVAGLVWLPLNLELLKRGTLPFDLRG